MKKIKSNKLVFSKKNITELTDQNLLEIMGGTNFEYPTTGVFTGSPICGKVLEIMQL